METPAFGKAYAEELLLPVKPGYVVLTFIAAFLLNMLPFTGWPLTLRPDFVAVIVLYWGIEHPRKVGFTPAFLLGLAMDVADGSLFGQHALAYCVLLAASIALHRRVTLFGLRGQMLHVLGILLVSQVIVLMVRIAAGDPFPGWWYFLPGISGCLIWPFIRHLVSMPLRPRIDPEDL